MIEFKAVCPLGCECEFIKDDISYRCAWLVGMSGKLPDSEQEVTESRCALAWIPILLSENAQTNRGQTQAIEVFKNNVVDQNMTFIGMFQKAIMEQQKNKIIDNKG